MGKVDSIVFDLGCVETLDSVSQVSMESLHSRR